MRKTLRIYACTRDDIHAGVVWTEYETSKIRPTVKIRNIANGRIVYCELMKIEGNFKKFYNKPCSGRAPITDTGKALVINNWYRDKLGINKTQIEVDLEITQPLFSLWSKFLACLQHPQIVVRMSMGFSTIGLILGILSFFISFK